MTSLFIPRATSSSLGASLANRARAIGLAFGSAASKAVLQEAEYASLLDYHCDCLVGENDFKWQYLEPLQGQYDHTDSRWLSEFTERKGKSLRGHCFLWNHEDRMPPWLVEHASGLAFRDYKDLTRHMWRHGAFLAREFPRIACWDAINEAIDPATGQMRETEFTRILGNRFFDLAFRIMAEKSPEARLVYNETMNWEESSHHRNGVLRLLERGLQRGLRAISRTRPSVTKTASTSP